MKKLYGERECLECGKIVREGAYSGRDGNFRKHVKSHEWQPTDPQNSGDIALAKELNAKKVSK